MKYTKAQQSMINNFKIFDKENGFNNDAEIKGIDFKLLMGVKYDY